MPEGRFCSIPGVAVASVSDGRLSCDVYGPVLCFEDLTDVTSTNTTPVMRYVLRKDGSVRHELERVETYCLMSS